MLRHKCGGCRPWQKVLSLSCMEQAASYCARAVTRTSSKKPSTPVLRRFSIATNDSSCVRRYCRSLPCEEALSVEQVHLLALVHLGVKHAAFRYCDLRLYPACCTAGLKVSRYPAHVTGRCPRGRPHHTAMQYCSW